MSADVESAREANRLYWESDISVAEIAQQLELSRRALYDAVLPLPAGTTCDVCGGEMVFENRSARTSGNTVCLQCRARMEDEEMDALEETAGANDIAWMHGRTARLSGAMLVGAALGLVATLVVVRR